VALGIQGDASDFTEMEVRRKFQEIGNGLKTDFGRLLSEERSGHEQAQK
jgi:hypothetical protein